MQRKGFLFIGSEIMSIRHIGEGLLDTAYWMEIMLVQNVDQSILYDISTAVDTMYSSKSENGLEFVKGYVVLNGILRVQGERTLVAAKALMNDKIDVPRISDIPVVQDFTEVFPEDLLGLPSQRRVEFRIYLVPRATPVAKSPYRLAPSEMQKLSEQLRELQDKGFIGPSHFRGRHLCYS
ncbi:hypothetical protein Tco_1327161 [Tanacetum coccineum]